MKLLRIKLAVCALMFMSSPSWSQTSVEQKDKTTTMKLRLCTAQAGNNYHRAGELIAIALRNHMAVQVIETKGSWENLETMSSSRPRCDAILAQDDAVALHRFQNEESKLAMERLAKLFEEKAHLICNRKVSADRFQDIAPNRVDMLTNEYGSGSFITWRVISKLNPIYRKFSASERGLDEALLKLLDNEKPTCLFYVSRLGGQTLNRANQNFGDRLKLVSFEAPKLEKVVSRLGRSLYRRDVIGAQVYPNLTNKTLPTVSVNAVFFLSSEWKAQNPGGSKLLSKSILELLSKHPHFKGSP